MPETLSSAPPPSATVPTKSERVKSDRGGAHRAKAPRVRAPLNDLEPSLVSGRTYVTRRRLTYVDAAALLSLMLVLISLIPANLIVPGMTDIGRPGLVVAFVLFCWWLLVRFTRHLVMTGPQPMRWAIFAFLMSAIASYAVAFMRSLTSIEKNGADRVLLFFFMLAGVTLMAADGIPNWFRLRNILNVLVWSAGLVGLIAVFEYVTGIDATTYMQIPGLQAKTPPLGFMERGDAFRVAATTAHYIELAAFLSLALPFAIHQALYGHSKAHRRAGLIFGVLIAAGNAATISRTGIIGIVLTFLALFPVWTWRVRYNMLVTSIGLFLAVGVAGPGLFRTLVRLFADTSQNSSIQARTGRYPMVFRYFAESPWLGRGTGTYVSPQYQVLDNQWLSTLMSNGIIGVAAMLGLYVTGIVLATKAMRRSSSPEVRHLCAALIATQLIAIASAATFDSFGYSTYVMTLGLCLGLCGTVWRLTHPTRTIRTSTTKWFLDRELEQANSLVRS
ncbi:MAG TPA: O-antigen ligase family protein [Micromonosporaceae bacterium]|nr:O-antigen ligase family protein [Micromonosporaceae bacterium]